MSRVKFTTTIQKDLLKKAKEKALSEGFDGANEVIEKALKMYFSNCQVEIWEKVENGCLKKLVKKPGKIVFQKIKSRKVLGNPQDIYCTISQLVSRRNSIVKVCAALKKQLQVYVMYNYPSYHKFFYVFDGKAALEFWETYPSPLKLKGVTVEAITALLRKHSNNYYTIEKAKEILYHVEADGDTTTDFQDVRDFIISSTVRQLKSNKAELDEVEKMIGQVVPLFQYKLQSMKGINVIIAFV